MNKRSHYKWTVKYNCIFITLNFHKYNGNKRIINRDVGSPQHNTFKSIYFMNHFPFNVPINNNSNTTLNEQQQQQRKIGFGLFKCIFWICSGAIGLFGPIELMFIVVFSYSISPRFMVHNNCKWESTLHSSE